MSIGFGMWFGALELLWILNENILSRAHSMEGYVLFVPQARVCKQ